MKKYGAIIGLFFCLCGAVAENRTALLIANGNYDNFGKLPNPLPEAEALKTALESLGFSVTIVRDGTRESMLDALDDFQASLSKRGGIAFFHYGGHGVQVAGKNYLLPSDADIPDERKVATRAVDVDEVMSTLEAANPDTSIVVLDACRNNPLPASSGRSATRGLAVLGTKPKNSIIIYAAESGSVAQDGLFTPALIRAISTPGLDLGQMAMRVRREVYEKSNGAQTPGAYDQLFSAVYLAGAAPLAAGVAPTQAVVQPPTPTVSINRPLGSLVVTATTAGSLFLDGRKLADLPGGADARLDSIETGSRRLEMRYEDGSHEEATVTINKGGVENVSFTYVKTVKQMREVTPLKTGDFVRIKAGAFSMGSPTTEEQRGSDEAMHDINLSAFWMGKYEVTIGEFKEFVGAAKYKTTAEATGEGTVWAGSNTMKQIGASWKNSYFTVKYKETDRNPVVIVSWFDAIAYCNWRSKAEGYDEVYAVGKDDVKWDRKAHGYRLPTEAEWEYACRAGTTKATSFGDSLNAKQANFKDAASNVWSAADVYLSRTAPVGSYKANPWGLYDMHGNVWEWCWDIYGPYSAEVNADPAGAESGTSRVIRGGGWANRAPFQRSANRDYFAPDYRMNDLGFRLVLQ